MVRTRALALLVVLLLALPLHAFASGPGHLVITQLYVDTYVSNEPDEFVQLANPTESSVDLSGWKLTDGEGTLTFPSGTSLAAGAHIYVTGNASAFRLDMVVA
ncbi:MAG: lamin tail domain-containing protein, partial [Halobacteriales archaeon]|nr:lamin tail domain-containing protein [Halobacteriales archaeon]